MTFHQTLDEICPRLQEKCKKEKGVRPWLFRGSSSIFHVLRAILKQAELTDEVLSSPNTLPISLCLRPPKLRHRYNAIPVLRSAHLDVFSLAPPTTYRTH